MTIDGKIIVIRPDTKLEGVPANGLRAQAEGQQQPDGKIVASSVKVAARADTGSKESEKEKPKAPAETPKAPEKQAEDKQTTEKGAVILSGIIRSHTPTELVVDGKIVTINSQTEIEGTPSVGRNVKIKGQLQENGKIAAISIEVTNPQRTD